MDSPADYADEFGQRLHALTRGAVGFKTVLAYRAGFDQNLSRPAPAAVAAAARRWQENLRAGTNPRLTDVTLIAHGIHTAVSMKLPLQFHVGFGDRDPVPRSPGHTHHAAPLLSLRTLSRLSGPRL